MEKLLPSENYNNDIEATPKKEEVFDLQPGVDPKIVEELAQKGVARKTEDNARIQEIKDNINEQTEKEPDRLFMTHIRTPIKDEEVFHIPNLTEEDFNVRLKTLEKQGMTLERERNVAKAAMNKKQAELDTSADFIKFLEDTRRPLEPKTTDTMSDRFFDRILNMWDKVDTYPSLITNRRKYKKLINELDELKAQYETKEEELIINQKQSMALVNAWQKQKDEILSDEKPLAA